MTRPVVLLSSLRMHKESSQGEETLIVTLPDNVPIRFQWPTVDMGYVRVIGSGVIEEIIRSAVAEHLGKIERNLSKEEVVECLVAEYNRQEKKAEES